MSDVWQDTCLVTITPKASGSGNSVDYEFAMRTSDIDFGNGSMDFEAVTFNSGGQARKRKRPDPAEWSFDNCYFLGVQANGEGRSVLQMFRNGTITSTGAYPLSIFNSRNRMLVRVAVLWSEDSSATSGAGATADGKLAYRKVIAEAELYDFKESWKDGILSASFKVKATQFDMDGNPNLMEQDTITSTGYTGLLALGDYNDDQKGQYINMSDGTTAIWE